MASIDQLLETLANPEGRFKTLEGIHLESENGEPHYSLHCGGAVAVFRVWWNSRPYELRFPLKDYERRNGAGAAAGRLPAAGACALPRRIFVPGWGDAAVRCVGALSLCRYGTGRAAARGASRRFSRRRVRPGGEGVACGAEEGVLPDGSLVVADTARACALKPANIIVMPGGAIRLVNYEAMCVPQMDDYAEHAADDRVALANLALGLTVLSASPEAYRALNGNSVFRTPVLRSSLLHLFDDLARQPGCGPMRQLTQMLQQSRYTPPQGEDLSAILEALADDPTEIVLPPRLMERIRVSSEPVGSVGTLSAETEIPAVPGSDRSLGV